MWDVTHTFNQQYEMGLSKDWDFPTIMAILRVKMMIDHWIWGCPLFRQTI